MVQVVQSLKGSCQGAQVPAQALGTGMGSCVKGAAVCKGSRKNCDEVYHSTPDKKKLIMCKILFGIQGEVQYSLQPNEDADQRLFNFYKADCLNFCKSDS
jgi:hypothetical protein